MNEADSKEENKGKRNYTMSYIFFSLNNSKFCYIEIVDKQISESNNPVKKSDKKIETVDKENDEIQDTDESNNAEKKSDEKNEIEGKPEDKIQDLEISKFNSLILYCIVYI